MHIVKMIILSNFGEIGAKIMASLSNKADDSIPSSPTPVTPAGEYESKSLLLFLSWYDIREWSQHCCFLIQLTDQQVDDVVEFLDDDAIQNMTTLFPAEQEQPESWPIDVVVIFLVASVILFVATAYKNWKKRSTHTEVPSTLEVCVFQHRDHSITSPS